MLWTKFKNQQIEQKITSFQIFQFQFRYQVISKNILIKTQKPQLCCCPDGLMVTVLFYTLASQSAEYCNHNLQLGAISGFPFVSIERPRA